MANAAAAAAALRDLQRETIDMFSYYRSGTLFIYNNILNSAQRRANRQALAIPDPARVLPKDIPVAQVDLLRMAAQTFGSVFGPTPRAALIRMVSRQNQGRLTRKLTKLLWRLKKKNILFVKTVRAV